jgi:hypothetical protein
MSVAACIIEHFHPELVDAFVLEVQHAADLQVVGAGEPLLVGVEEHVTLPVEHDFDRPTAKSAADFPQGNLGRLLAGEILCELLQELLWAERILGDEDSVLEEVFVEADRLLLLRRW